MIQSLRIGVVSALLFFAAACQTVQNPATGENQFSTVSPEQERQIGAQEHPKVLAEFGGEYRDPQLQTYVQRVGRKLAANAELPADQFTFTLLDSPVVNAFALPGGYVYITRGMLGVLNTEAEMAGVLGHEIGHVTARHGASRQTKGLFANLAVVGAALLTGSQEIAQLGQVAARGYLASHSRSQERESDSLGIRYLARSGYDPVGMANGLMALGRHGDLMARMSGQEARQMSFLATHPLTRERVAATTREARQTQTNGEGRVGKESYLNAIEGMIYGSSPEQGFVRGNRFAHPVLRFTFTVPEGFKVDNLPQAVIARDRNNRAQIIFDQEANRQIAASGVRMDTYIAQQWAKGARLFDLDRIAINGMAAATAVAQVNSNGQQIDARLVAIRFNREKIYRFVFATPADQTRNFSRAFRQTTFSFERLSQREANRFKPQRIEIVQVRRGDTISKLTRQDVQDGFEDDRFRVINGMDRDDTLRAGDLVKVIR